MTGHSLVRRSSIPCTRRVSVNTRGAWQWGQGLVKASGLWNHVVTHVSQPGTTLQHLAKMTRDVIGDTWQIHVRHLRVSQRRIFNPSGTGVSLVNENTESSFVEMSASFSIICKVARKGISERDCVLSLYNITCCCCEASEDTSSTTSSKAHWLPATSGGWLGHDNCRFLAGASRSSSGTTKDFRELTFQNFGPA